MRSSHSSLSAQCHFQFPDPQQADPEGHGLVAVGGDLSPPTLVAAYQAGIFPWFNDDEPICWWSPEPRCIIEPHLFAPSKSLLRTMKKFNYQVRIDTAFANVIAQCAAPRAYSDETWISSHIIDSYIQLHQLGIAHSVEIWDGMQLIGGLYGLSFGRCFFGESMFNTRTDCSKMAFYVLMLLCAEQNCPWVDCQLPNEHLMNLGAQTLPRAEFLAQLETYQHLTDIDWHYYQNRVFSTQTIAEKRNLTVAEPS